ncbi:DNA-processing protein DprA [Carnobacterium maltaromaticum]|uniref:DNA-processing protein DprA n=1 Tax=Carnobacterium maltaromaticum TaxID=2751 RepID=UPI0039BDBC76
MTNNIKSELFFLKQFGYSDSLLEYIFLYGQNPIYFIFDNEEYSDIEKKLFTKKDEKLSFCKEEYKRFKIELFKKEDFLKKNSNNKIYFKYDETYFNELLPDRIHPLFMYSKGDEELLNNNLKRISVVGTRKPNEESVTATKKLVKKYVEEGCVIVSGLAEGIDSVAHEVTLKNHGKTIAVLPTNFNNIYPKKNQILAQNVQKHGLLITSIGPNEHTFKSSFLERNQYVANISEVLLVIETNLKSGTMNTIKNASLANKKILFIDQKNEEVNEKIKQYGGVEVNGY